MILIDLDAHNVVQNVQDTTQNYTKKKKKKNLITFDWEETINKDRP